MKKKFLFYLASFLFLFTFTNTLKANDLDTMRWYFKPTDEVYFSSLLSITQELNQWSREIKAPKGIIVVYPVYKYINLSSYDLSIEIQKVLTIWDLYNIGVPDYYSYVDSVPVFWFFGINKLIPPDPKFVKFIKNRFYKSVSNIYKEFNEYSYDAEKRCMVRSDGFLTPIRAAKFVLDPFAPEFKISPKYFINSENGNISISKYSDFIHRANAK